MSRMDDVLAAGMRQNLSLFLMRVFGDLHAGAGICGPFATRFRMRASARARGSSSTCRHAI